MLGLQVRISAYREDVLDGVNATSEFFLYVAIISGIAGVAAAFFLARTVSRPLSQLNTGINTAAGGDLSVGL